MTERPLRVLAWPAYANRDNPYHALLHDHLRTYDVTVEEYSPAALHRADWDVFHVHWPEFLLGAGPPTRRLLRVGAFVHRVRRARRRGRRVVWTVHNLTPHDRGASGRALYRTMSTIVDGVVGLSDASLDDARRRYPRLRRRPGFVVPHGHLRSVYPRSVSPTDARRRLGLAPEERVVLFFGSIRPYKQVDRLLDVFARLPGDDLRLVVAGPAPDGLRSSITSMAVRDPRVRLRLEFVPDDEVQHLLLAADLVVLPHDASMLNSGVALLALSFDRPVLAPAAGSLLELQRSVGRQWVHTFGGALGPDDLLATLTATRAMPSDVVAPLDELEWDVIAGRMAAVYRELVPL